MKSQRKQHYQPWGSGELSGVEFFCRSKIPDVPELAVTYLGPPLAIFEYDFVHERQVVADHDQYLELKSRLEGQNSKPPEPVGLQSDSKANASDVPGVTPQSHTSTQVTCTASVALPHTSYSQTVCQKAKHDIPPPIAARQLVVGQILQPCKTDPNTLSEHIINGETHTTTSTTTRMTPSATADAGQARQNLLSIRDFESGPDDPFGSAELKTINDLEELSNVLSSTTTVPRSHPSSAVISSSPINTQWTDVSYVAHHPHMNSIGQRSSSSSQKLVCFYSGSDQPNSVRSGKPLLPPPHSSTHVPNHGMPSTDLTHYDITKPHFIHPDPANPINVHAYRVMHSSPRVLSSSVPNLETASNVDRPLSVTTSSDVHKIYRPIAHKPAGLVGNYMQPQPVLRLPFTNLVHSSGQTLVTGSFDPLCRARNSKTPPIVCTSQPLYPNQGVPRFPSHHNSTCGP